LKIILKIIQPVLPTKNLQKQIICTCTKKTIYGKKLDTIENIQIPKKSYPEKSIQIPRKSNQKTN